MVWNASPIIFQIGPVAIRWYSLCFAVSFLIGNAIMEKIYRKEGKNEENLFALLVHMIAGTVIGARLGQVLFYEPGYFFSHLSEIPQVWHGGLASHGAAIAIPISIWLYARKHRDEPYWWLMDRLGIITALAGFFIRVGNFFNSEILGKASDLPWAIVFARVDQIPRHPAMLYEAACYLAIFVYLYCSYWRQTNAGKKIPQGEHFGKFLMLIFGVRIVIEFCKERQSAFEIGLPLDMGQLLSIPLVIFGAWLIWRARKNSLSSKYH
jgi:phosphatidylglycerol:prolipoprotein diacylglycerol transferase